MENCSNAVVAVGVFTSEPLNISGGLIPSKCSVYNPQTNALI